MASSDNGVEFYSRWNLAIAPIMALSTELSDVRALYVFTSWYPADCHMLMRENDIVTLLLKSLGCLTNAEEWQRFEIILRLCHRKDRDTLKKDYAFSNIIVETLSALLTRIPSSYLARETIFLISDHT